MVDDLDNGSKAASVLALHEQNDSANLNESPGGGLNINVRHLGGLSSRQSLITTRKRLAQIVPVCVAVVSCRCCLAQLNHESRKNDLEADRLGKANVRTRPSTPAERSSLRGPSF